MIQKCPPNRILLLTKIAIAMIIMISILCLAISYTSDYEYNSAGIVENNVEESKILTVEKNENSEEIAVDLANDSSEDKVSTLKNMIPENVECEFDANKFNSCKEHLVYLIDEISIANIESEEIVNAEVENYAESVSGVFILKIVLLLISIGTGIILFFLIFRIVSRFIKDDRSKKMCRIVFRR